MNLQEDAEDDLVWEEELDVEEIKPKWLVIGRLLAQKSFTNSTLIAHMKATWNPARTMVWMRINANLFTIEFNCLGDWNKAMHEGPWDFRGLALILTQYDGFSKPEKVKLDRLETWCQIHRLPDGVLKSNSALENLERRISLVEEVHVTLPSGYVGEIIRVRVKLDVNKKLSRVFGITKAGVTEKYLIKFEKLPTFCNACRLMGHWHEERGSLSMTWKSLNGGYPLWHLGEGKEVAGEVVTLAVVGVWLKIPPVVVEAVVVVLGMAEGAMKECSRYVLATQMMGI
ncbi:hypothetical protein D1007_07316 [Hordeum vulgare]|nr:hypothetical protein D1007_07316 [Hordeum vulgare]